MDAIPLQILIRDGYRTSEAIAGVAQQLRSLGFDVTGSGRATLSARASTSTFKRLFGLPAPAPDGDAASARDPAAGDSMELPIPAALHDAIASISVAPTFIHLLRPERKGGSP